MLLLRGNDINFSVGPSSGACAPRLPSITSKTYNMKSRFTIFSASLLLAVLFTACATKPGYTVTGTAEGTVDGDTVYLSSMQGFFQFVPEDTAIVKDGEFKFTGEIDGAALRFIVPTHKGCAQGFGMAQILLENADIHVEIFSEQSGKEAVVTSTGENYVLLKEFEKLDSTYTARITPYWEKVNAGNDSTAESAAAQAAIDKLTAERRQKVYDFIVKNIPSGFSDLLLLYEYPNFEPEMQKAVLDEFAKHKAETPNYLSIVNAQKAAAATAEGESYTDIEMDDPTGRKIKVSDYVGKNKYTLIDFWASWCGPCRAEMPNVVAAYDKFHSKGLEIVGVSLDNDGAAWRKAIKDLNMPWPQMSDLKGWESEGAAAYNVTAIPANVLVDQKGVIVAKDLREEALHAKLAELLGE